MAVSWTIPGGHHSVLSLNPHEYAAAHNALAALKGDFNHELVHAGMGHATMLGGEEGYRFGDQGGQQFGGQQEHQFTDYTVRFGHQTVAGAQHNVFDFNASPTGGHHLITDFAQGGDQYRLAAYDTTTAFGHEQHHGGAILTLDGGKTEITLNGFHNMHRG